MKLSKFSDYSLRVLIFLALKRPEELSTVREISKHYDISQNHLIKVVHKLSTLGIIEGIKGRGGGIYLPAKNYKIQLGSLVKKLEGTEFLVECFQDKGLCKIGQYCRLKGVLREAQEAFYQVLNQYHLEDILTPKLKLKEALNIS